MEVIFFNICIMLHRKHNAVYQVGLMLFHWMSWKVPREWNFRIWFQLLQGSMDFHPLLSYKESNSLISSRMCYSIFVILLIMYLKDLLLFCDRILTST